MDGRIASVFSVFFICLTALVQGCGGGGGGSGGSDRANNPGTQAPSELHGTIVFEQAHDYGFIDHQGVSSFNLDNNQISLLTDGLYPRRHPQNGDTVFLQLCAQLPSEGDFYRVAIADAQGSITPVSPCSTEIANPTTGVFLLEDITRFGLVGISPNANLISVNLSYNILSADQSYVVGKAYNTAIYDRQGQWITEFENAYDAAWLPDGRLMFVFGNHFFLTDSNLDNPQQIPDGDQLSTPVNNPAVHPNGQRFVFEYNNQLWQMNMDGSNLQRVQSAQRRLRYPAWSPDGNWLVFTAWDKSTTVASTLTSLFFYSPGLGRSLRVDLDPQQLQTLAEPWGPLTWVD